ncbi:MAG: EF-P beta-lysylation protein EpmB [Gammaproteobacteria bacterium]|nr:EF-P beta-lysylation protein EpmB [Gammaproteobacteria bacterium]
MHHSVTDNNNPNNSWQSQLKNTINNLEDLCSIVNIDFTELKKHYLNLNPTFPLRAPKYFVDKITKSNIDDPLLLQILPLSQELITEPGYCQDPLGENQNYIKAPGLIHKYNNRILLTLTSACGIHCRYCFRQYFPYSKNIIATNQRNLQLDYIRSHNHINEVILSGGDPLCVSNNYLDLILAELSSIKHIQTIRFHSRMPIVIPDRIDNSFLEILDRYSNNFKFVLVTHCNHPNELDDYIKYKMKLLKNNNVTLLNQSVLLKNINNNPEILINLSKKLFDCYILPYYLHLLDPVQGAGHFDLTEIQAKKIFQEINSKLSGYLVPRLVREIPGKLNKTVIL